MMGPHLTRGALDGLRVLDVTQVMAGPFCSMLLADLGANVIKIEPPAGDSTRQMPGAVGTDSPSFNAVNRGKRSVVLDLKTPEGRDVFTRLARTADILVENYRPGVMTSFGLDYAALAPINPRLIYASISGYGQTGPDRAGRIRNHVDHRRAGPAAGESRCAADGPRRRTLCAGRHSGRARSASP